MQYVWRTGLAHSKAHSVSTSWNLAVSLVGQAVLDASPRSTPRSREKRKQVGGLGESAGKCTARGHGKG